MKSDIQARLDALFDAERAVRKAHEELLKQDKVAVVAAAREAVGAALAALAAPPPGGATDDANIRLVRLAALLGDCEGGDVAVDALIDVLACEEPEARHVAGQALEDLAFDRFKEVALGVERALDRLPVGNAALGELPYLLAEVGEPGSLKLLGRFLRHDDPNAVAAAIEALVEMGDPQSAPLLKALEKDTRQVQVDDDDAERVSIGDLAAEARQLLMELEPAPRKGGR